MIYYLIGFVITYYYVRHIWITIESPTKERTWKDVGITALVALFSWFGLFMFCMWAAVKLKGTKPPKFL